MKALELGLGVGLVSMWGLTACGTYQELNPGAESVTATTSRPAGNCRALGTLTGKGGGATGAYVSNENLIEYAVNDLRNQAWGLGATHVVYSTPSMGGNEGTTTSAMVMGEALRCEGDERPSGPAAPVAAPAPVVAAPSGGCDYDTQCKGDRVCKNHQCVDPAPSSNASAASGATPTPAAAPPADATAANPAAPKQP
jgi:hypothetical protein